MDQMKRAFEDKGFKQKNRHRKNKHKRIQTEHLSDYEIKKLMGVYEPTYKRSRGGAYRQK